MTRFMGCFFLLASLSAPALEAAQAPQPAPEMQSLTKALAGRWSIIEKYEPDQWTPNGGAGKGEEVWRSGPGNFTLIEEYHSQTPAGETFGLALMWWDRVKGLQGTWCSPANPKGCDIDPSAPGPKWDGKQLVIETEFPRNGKKFIWHEVFSDITSTSFTQTADLGEVGGPLKRWVTIHATREQGTSREARRGVPDVTAPLTSTNAWPAAPFKFHSRFIPLHSFPLLTIASCANLCYGCGETSFVCHLKSSRCAIPPFLFAPKLSQS